jgi:transferrin binding protein
MIANSWIGNGAGSDMNANTVVFGRRITQLAATLSIVIALGGCGGGGGGGGGGGLGPGGSQGFTYPASLAAATTAEIGGFSAAYSFDSTNDRLSSVVPGTLGGAVVVNVNTPTAGDYIVNVSGIVHSGTVEPPFSFTVRNAGMTGGRAVAGATCATGTGCFRTPNAPGLTASDGGAVTLIDLDMAAAQLTYSTMGLWSKPSSRAGSPTIDVGGAFSFGVQTRGADLPTTGTATYNGPMLGRYANGTEIFTVGAAATGRANFGVADANFGGSNVPGRTVAFATTLTTITPSIGASIAAPNLNLTGSFAYTPGTNQLVSTSLSTAGGLTGPTSLSGTARAVFFGPPATLAPFAPPELGGAFAVTNGSNESMVGSFGLKR